MPFNGSGVFNRIYSWVQDAANGIDVSSTRTDTDTNDIALGLSTCITKDGQTTVTANIPMSGFKLTGLGLGSAVTDSARVDNAYSLALCEFRLTLTSGVPVTTTDVTAATTLYCTPYKGTGIALYDGTNWHRRTSTEMSIAVPATTSTMYDVFCYDNSGTPTLELLAWSTDTSRATALTFQNGVYVKTGALTRRYIGSFRTTGSSGQTEDSNAKRYVWNYYNRVVRRMYVTDGTASWNYTTATFRQANGSTANQLDFVIGVSEDAVRALVSAAFKNTSAGVLVQVGIGLDITNNTSIVGGQGKSQSISNEYPIYAEYLDYPGVGRHFLAWVEWSAATGTTTWEGVTYSNIEGSVLG